MIIASPQLGLNPNAALGAERIDAEIIKGLAEKGHSIHVLLPKNKTHVGHSNIHPTYTPISAIAPPYIFNLFVIIYLHRLYKQVRFGLIRCHNPYFVGIASLLFKMVHPEVLVVTVYYHQETSWLQQLLDPILLPRFDRIVVISNTTRRFLLEKYRLPDEKVCMVSCGVDPSLAKRSRSKTLVARHNLHGKKVLLVFSRLIPRKNPLFALDVLAKIPDDNVVLVIAGTGPLGLWLRLKSYILGISHRVQWVGRVHHRDRCAYFNLADIYLLPSKNEGFGMMPLESLLCERVPIVSDQGSLPEIIQDGVDGFVLPLDPSVWADTIRSLLSNERKRVSMGKKGRERVEKTYTWSRSVRLTEVCFLSLLTADA